MRANHPRSEFGRRKAELFNERFALGELVAVRRIPGEPASWDRVFAPAYGAGDGAMVELASSRMPVDTDIVFSLTPKGWTEDELKAAKVFCGIDPQLSRCQEPRHLGGWAIACAFLLGFASAVVLALVQPAKAQPIAQPVEITSDSGEPA